MNIRYLIVVLAMSLPVIQQAAAQSHEEHQHHQQQVSKEWSSQPLLVKPAGRGSRTLKALKPVNLSAEQMRVYPSINPDEGDVSWEVLVEEGKAKIASRSGEQGGYHWVSAREDSENSVRIASTVTYFSNPGPAPRHMLRQDKVELEIQPVRLPREHQQYRANETWPFQLLHLGEPLADTEVMFESKNGSRSVYTTDDTGRFDVTFPDDFPVEKPDAKEGGGHGGHGRAKSAFVLSSSLQRDDLTITSAFNYKYTPDAFADKSMALGIGMLMLGMFAATPLLRNKKQAAEGEQS